MNKESLRAPLENGLKRALAGKGGRAEPMFVMSGPPNGQKSGDPEAHNQNDDDQDGPSLTQSQELALPALLTCPTVKAAARQCGVHERTIRRWLHDDEHFQKTLRQFRNEALSQASTHLQQGATHAVGAMYELIGSDGLIETGRWPYPPCSPAPRSRPLPVNVVSTSAPFAAGSTTTSTSKRRSANSATKLSARRRRTSSRERPTR